MSARITASRASRSFSELLDRVRYLPPPDPAFADDLVAARAARPARPEDPWES